MSKLTLVVVLAFAASTALAEEGLKTVNYANETSDSKDEKAPTLSADQMEKAKVDIEAFKKKQEESQKALKALDEEEE